MTLSAILMICSSCCSYSMGVVLLEKSKILSIFFRSAYFRIICDSFGELCKKTRRMNLPNTIGLMFIYVHCQPCDPRGLAKHFLCTDCTEKTRSSRGGKTAYGSIAPFCIRWSSVVTKLLLRVCKKEGSCRTSVKPLVGLHLSVGL